MKEIEQYLSALVIPLLVRPESARWVESTDDMGILFTLTIAREDMGNLIGKGGETAKAVRHLVRAFGMKHNARVSIRITEPDGTIYQPKLAVRE